MSGFSVLCIRGYYVTRFGGREVVAHVGKPQKQLADISEFPNLAAAAEALADRRHLSRKARKQREAQR